MKWEEFKAKAYATLMEETKKRRKEARMASNNEVITEYEGLLCYLHGSRAPPSRERVEIARKLREGLREEVRKFKPAGPNTAHKRFAREEQSTKEFYRQFRTKHANMNINEINVVEDWDHPIEVGTTSDKEEIKEQAARYYSWLYSPKETSNLHKEDCLLYTSPSPRDRTRTRMPSSA